jgi:glycosyltransferase involved in cell wall biosynthesis
VPLDADQVKLARELRVEPAVVELGSVTDDRLVELYNASDVLLFPSHLEGFGLPVLEAMACGTPVVASNAPSLLEVAGNAALVAAPTDVRSLSEAVASVISSRPLALELRKRGRVRAAEFAWHRTAREYAAVYESVFAANARSALPVMPV